MAPTSEWTVSTPAGALPLAERMGFVKRTYGHLLGAVMAFVIFELFLFRVGAAETIARAMIGTPWLLILGAFVLVSWLASRVAGSASSPALQYVGLFGYVVAEGLIFVPLLFVAERYAPGVISSAAWITILGFGGLTAVVFLTGKDFSFLGSLLWWTGIVALLLFASVALFGTHLGTWFSVAMVALAGGSILYDTSNVLHRYPADRHVSAALALFASVALMFWYVIRILMAARR